MATSGWGAGGGAGSAGGEPSGGGLPEFTKTGAPGVVSTRVWVGWHLRGMRKPLEAKAGLGRAWAGLATARGGRRGGASPACGVPGAKAVYGPSYLAKATREALGAHRGRGAVEVAAAGRRRRGSRAELGRSSGPGRWRAPLGVQAPQVEPWRCCEAGLRVRAARGLKTARNCSGGAYRRRRSWQRDAAALVIRAWGCGRDVDGTCRGMRVGV